MRREVLYVLTIAIGLLISAEYAQWPVDIWCIGIFSYIFWVTDRKERIEMLAVLAFATPMELFFSEVWLIYEYQRGFMPLFVPVGHYFLFDLGRRVAKRLPEGSPMPLVLLLVPLVIYGAIQGTDTSAVFLILLTLGFTMYGPEPRLYASMVWLALFMELWGTYLENWEWAANVPWTGLTAWNPPLLVGAFYCFGDLLVNLSVAKFEGQPMAEVNHDVLG
ncbi:MAG: hypothetical protein CMA49_04590 [Euryarchaeota archaeon]|nr:hypothetical protein [Euryarchaeota archaeon]DAC20269.1 MAG TPA: hypothetical protein D7H90_00750 [Candidatus Poseidoniales archaeon]DAC49350.1 MAG TPA: hypothetical protein D7H87_06285 [Candidatus Poseidoniales archaeon]HII32895.1 hypothetical protein [Candidatus Poseidoniaceae archaeon]HII56054.1 hypothetical protein [Candidatus Poseidoniaceae archaeon]|tara:strand:+ start:2666 stop:3325 length:660 start_codon:yes stop_codon:yes gene_type:complete